MPKVLTIYGRSYCHLCSEMEEALAGISKELGFVLECVDVDTDSELEDRFGERVPVLMAGDIELCHHFLDESAVRAQFSA